MAINTTIKTNPNAPQSQMPARPAQKINQPSVSTARAEALKARLRAPQAPAQTQAPRAAGSTLRQQQYSTQPKYPVAAPVATPTPQPTTQPGMDIEPPPSGNPAVRNGTAVGEATVAPQSESVRQSVIGEEAPKAPAEVTSEPDRAQFAALARREQQIRKAQQALKAEQDAFAAKQADYISRNMLLADPLKTLAETGLDYSRLTELQLNQINPDPVQPLVAKIEALEAKLAQVDKTFADRDNLQEQQVLTQMRADVEALAKTDPAYETIAATESYGDVVELIHKVFKAEGVILSVEEAAEAVENKLVEREYQRYEKLSKLQKIKSRLAPPAPVVPVTEEKTEAEANPPQQPASTTLSNKGSRTKPMTPRDRVIARLKGQIA